jgi:hypothetical protein
METQDGEDWQLTPQALLIGDCCGADCCGASCCGVRCCAGGERTHRAGEVMRIETLASMPRGHHAVSRDLSAR